MIVARSMVTMKYYRSLKHKLVVVRLLGGVGYWPYGVEQLSAVCRERGIPLALLPGDDQPDAELARLLTLSGEACHRLWQYCVHGGPDNARELNCIEGGWYFGEGGGNWSTIPECIPWKPDWKFPRHLEQTHTYSQPGIYDVKSTHGPLETSLVVEVP